MGTQTTPAAILESLKETIAGLTPAGGNDTGVGIERSFIPFEGESWKEETEDLEETELDRHFIIEGLEPQAVKIIGGSEYDLYTGEVDITIGHQIGEYRAARDRRDADIHQLIVQLQSNDNFPSGVVKIRLIATDKEIIQEGLYWITLIRLGLHYLISSSYGS